MLWWGGMPDRTWQVTGSPGAQPAQHSASTAHPWRHEACTRGALAGAGAGDDGMMASHDLPPARWSSGDQQRMVLQLDPRASWAGLTSTAAVVAGWTIHVIDRDTHAARRKPAQRTYSGGQPAIPPVQGRRSPRDCMASAHSSSPFLVASSLTSHTGTFGRYHPRPDTGILGRALCDPRGAGARPMSVRYVHSQ